MRTLVVLAVLATALESAEAFAAPRLVARASGTSVVVRSRAQLARAPDAARAPVLRMSTTAGAPAPGGGILATLKIGALFGVWFALNIVYNISNKKILNAFPFPYTVAVAQLGIGLFYLLPLWMTPLRKAPKLTADNVKVLAPIAAMHALGHLCTVISLGAGAVSFTHIVKAAEPFFSTVMSAAILKSVFPLPVYAALIPVVGGVGIASLSELSFSWVAFLNAMGSNTFFSLRAIFSKQAMEKPQGENMGASNLYGVLTIMSFLGLLPLALVMESPLKLKAGWDAAIAAGHTARYLTQTALTSGFFYYLYNEVAFLCLDSVHPITHAVGNTIKRVVIILASVVVFGTTMTPLNKIGSTLAIFGVLLYSLAKQYCK